MLSYVYVEEYISLIRTKPLAKGARLLRAGDGLILGASHGSSSTHRRMGIFFGGLSLGALYFHPMGA